MLRTGSNGATAGGAGKSETVVVRMETSRGCECGSVLCVQLSRSRMERKMTATLWNHETRWGEKREKAREKGKRSEYVSK